MRDTKGRPVTPATHPARDWKAKWPDGKCVTCRTVIPQGGASICIPGAPKARKLYCRNAACAPAGYGEAFAAITGDPAPSRIDGTQMPLTPAPAAKVEQPTSPAPSVPQNGEAVEALGALAGALIPLIDGRIGAQTAPVDEAAVQALIDAALKGHSKTVNVTLPKVGKVECDGEHEEFPTLLRELAIGHRCLLVGPAGSGKTTATYRAAKKLGWDADRIWLIPAKMASYDFMGYMDAQGNYVATDLYRWAKSEGTAEKPSVLILDEIDACHPNALCALSSALANGVIAFPNGEQVHIDEATHYVVATANTWGLGAGASDYVGANKLDARTLNRFQTKLAWDYDEKIERAMCAQRGGDSSALDKALAVRANLRTAGIKLIWSPRDTVAVARRVASGCDLGEALRVSSLNQLDASQRSRALNGVVS